MPFKESVRESPQVMQTARTWFQAVEHSEQYK